MNLAHGESQRRHSLIPTTPSPANEITPTLGIGFDGEPQEPAKHKKTIGLTSTTRYVITTNIDRAPRIQVWLQVAMPNPDVCGLITDGMFLGFGLA